MKDGALQTIEWTRELVFDGKSGFEGNARQQYWFTNEEGVQTMGG